MSPLISFLMHNADNRGVLAALRQGLIATTEMRAWPWLSRFGGIGQKLSSRAIRTVAGLFAHHPQMCSQGNMGDTCRMLCSDDEHPWEVVDAENKAIKPGAMSRKFEWLLASDVNEICDRTIRLVLYAKSKAIPINYAQLEDDLISWPRAREKWANAFWAAEKKDTDDQLDLQE